MEFSERNVEYGYAYASAAALSRRFSCRSPPWLTMVGAIATHVRLGEINRLAPAIMLLAPALFVAIQLF